MYRVAVSSHCTGEGNACHWHLSPDSAQSVSSLHWVYPFLIYSWNLCMSIFRILTYKFLVQKMYIWVCENSCTKAFGTHSMATTPSVLFYKAQFYITRSSKLYFDHIFILLYIIYTYKLMMDIRFNDKSNHIKFVL